MSVCPQLLAAYVRGVGPEGHRGLLLMQEGPTGPGWRSWAVSSRTEGSSEPGMSFQHSTEGDVKEKWHEKRDGGAQGERARTTPKELIACQQLLDNGVFPSWLLLSEGQFVLMIEQ